VSAGDDGDQPFRGLDAKFVVLRHAAISPEPTEAALDDPVRADVLEGALGAFHDLKASPGARLRMAGKFPALVACIGDHRVDPRPERAQPGGLRASCLAIGHVRRLNATRDEKTETVDERLIELLTPSLMTARALAGRRRRTMGGNRWTRL
jgi:hypothetical protein